MKIFKIPKKIVEGQCNAMRCTEDATESNCNYLGKGLVDLCAIHAKDLERYMLKNPVSETAQPATEIVKDGSLKNILVSNLAVKTGAVEAREETAEEIYEIATDIKVLDPPTRDNADQLLSLVHEEEKQLKAEIAGMYKPVKDAAKSTKTTLDSWFGPTLDFYSKSKDILKERIGDFIRSEKAKEDLALELGDHEAAASCATEASDNIILRRSHSFSILQGGPDLPLEFLVPDEANNDEIVKLLPRAMLRPNRILLQQLVDEYGMQLEIPGVKVMLEEKVQMKGKRGKQS